MPEMLIPLLSRWKWGLALAGLLAFTGLGVAALHYRGALRAERAGRAADRASHVAARPRPPTCLPKRSTIRKRSTG